VAASFARLAGLAQGARRDGERDLDVLVQETLRPLLQAWLDEHLPSLVERLVRDEIARVVGQSGPSAL
jgi:cell pole-organizing protein PopZ